MTVTSTDCVFLGNAAPGGGAIFADGDVTDTRGTFEGNGGGTTQFGGAIYSQGGSVVLTGSAFLGNSSTKAGSGGGAVQGSSITAVDSLFSNNATLQNGGALLAGYVDVTGSRFVGNSAPGAANDGLGGAIWANSATATTSEFLMNTAAAGGAIGAPGGIVVRRSTFAGNAASLYGGAVYSTGSVIQSWNSTYSGNTAVAGGALMAGGSLALASLTFEGNAADVGSSVLTGGTASMANIIFADGSGWSCQLTGTIFDNGGNLTVDGICPGTPTMPADLKLGALVDNGGPTSTIALGQGSAAIDAGVNEPCTGAPDEGIDQRGAMRPQGGACDSGAFETGTFDEAAPPPPWLQAYGRTTAMAPCTDGYAPSWAEWPNGGAGGFTCECSTGWDANAQKWVEKPGFVFKSRNTR